MNPTDSTRRRRYLGLILAATILWLVATYVVFPTFGVHFGQGCTTIDCITGNHTASPKVNAADEAASAERLQLERPRPRG